ncbi:MAG: N-acetylglucosamine-6-phosphate deacetylase [Peptococcaceae bacterium]|nr:N-acetylglucosamine-6-phosphate deacetylase [Peptococcaceae bacterium]
MIVLADIELYTPRQIIPHAALLIDGEKISAYGAADRVEIPATAQVISLPGKKAFPGFIDLHTHGLLGYDAMSAHLADVIHSFPRFGVTSFLATTITLPMDEIFIRLEEVTDVLDKPQVGAKCLGIHLEGPHLSPKRSGMANSTWFHPLTKVEFEDLQRIAAGRIRMITFAPEEGGAFNLIPYLIEQGVVPVIGHSDASYEQTADWVSLGLAHATHTFNAMNPFHHRAPGVIGAVLAMPQIIAQLIADNHHVHVGAMRALLNAKGPHGVCLISDAAPFAALPDGAYTWKEYTLNIRNGSCQLENGTLAGAHALMDTGFRNLIHLVGLTPSDASICASEVPARVLGLEKQKGALLPGFDADLVVTDENYYPHLTMVGGQVVWQAD